MKSSQTVRPESTSTSGTSRQAITTLPRTSSTFRSIRSASAPSAGPASTGAHMANTVSAARLFDPVSDLTQMPAVSHIADVPKPETTTPARQRPAVGPAGPSPPPNRRPCRCRPLRSMLRAAHPRCVAAHGEGVRPFDGIGRIP